MKRNYLLCNTLTSMLMGTRKVCKWKRHAVMQSIKVHLSVLLLHYILSCSETRWWSYFSIAHSFCDKYYPYCNDGVEDEKKARILSVTLTSSALLLVPIIDPTGHLICFTVPFPHFELKFVSSKYLQWHVKSNIKMIVKKHGMKKSINMYKGFPPSKTKTAILLLTHSTKHTAELDE